MHRLHTIVALAAFCLATSGAVQPAYAESHAGCAAGQLFTAGELEIAGAFTRATLPAAKVAGGYFTIRNTGATADRLLGGTAEAVERTEIHQMEMVGDMMKMSRVDGGLEIPAGATVTLAPGGYHLMMIGLRNPLAEGDCLEVTLEFEQAGEVPVVLSIGAVGADAAPGEHVGH